MGIVNYDHTDFTVIGRSGYSKIGLGVLGSSRFDSIETLVSESKKHPKSVKIATNIGLPVHLTPLMFAEGAGELNSTSFKTGGGSKTACIHPWQTHGSVSLLAS